MTAERIARLRERYRDRGGKDAELVRELLSEVQRLQQENVQLRKVSDGFRDIAGGALSRMTR